MRQKNKPKIAIFDYKLKKGNPIGYCQSKIIDSLSDRVDFAAVFVESDLSFKEEAFKIKYDMIFTQPLALVNIERHIKYLYHYTKNYKKLSSYTVQSPEGNFLFADICYAHFCHKFYINNQIVKKPTIRSALHFLDHYLRSLSEAYVLRKSKVIVVPSYGLKSEIEKTYKIYGKIKVIPNVVEDIYKDIKISKKQETINILFVGLGHFERKGLHLIIDAMKMIEDCDMRLYVIGGNSRSLKEYIETVDKSGLSEKVVFTGTVDNLYDYLEMGDIFVMPSSYEVFPLAALEAATAGKIILATEGLNGTSEYIVDGYNGFTFNRDAIDIAKKLRKINDMSDQELFNMKNNARRSVEKYSIAGISEQWLALYREISK